MVPGLKFKFDGTPESFKNLMFRCPELKDNENIVNLIISILQHNCANELVCYSIKSMTRIDENGNEDEYNFVVEYRLAVQNLTSGLLDIDSKELNRWTKAEAVPANIYVPIYEMVNAYDDNDSECEADYEAMMREDINYPPKLSNFASRPECFANETFASGRLVRVNPNPDDNDFECGDDDYEAMMRKAINYPPALSDFASIPKCFANETFNTVFGFIKYIPASKAYIIYD